MGKKLVLTLLRNQLVRTMIIPFIGTNGIMSGKNALVKCSNKHDFCKFRSILIEIETHISKYSIPNHAI